MSIARINVGQTMNDMCQAGFYGNCEAFCFKIMWM